MRALSISFSPGIWLAWRGRRKWMLNQNCANHTKECERRNRETSKGSDLISANSAAAYQQHRCPQDVLVGKMQFSHDGTPLAPSRVFTPFFLPHSATRSALPFECMCVRRSTHFAVPPPSPRRRSLLRDFASHRLRRFVAALGAPRIGGCSSVVCIVRDIGQGTPPGLWGNFPFPHPHHEAGRPPYLTPNLSGYPTPPSLAPVATHPVHKLHEGRPSPFSFSAAVILRLAPARVFAAVCDIS